MGAEAYQRAKCKKKKVQRLVILSETKNVDCDVINPCYGQILRLCLRMTENLANLVVISEEMERKI